MDKSPFRHLFSLDPSLIFLDNLLLSSHSIPLQQKITEFRTDLNKGAGSFWVRNFKEQDERGFYAIANFLECNDEEIAITSSSTMSVGITLGGFFPEGDCEVLIGEQDHYSVHKATEYNSRTKGWTSKTISWYEDPFLVTDEEVLGYLAKSITERTRIVFATWVHSATGVKLPIAKMGDYIKDLNKSRSNKIILIVDGTHAFGVENFRIHDLNCHVFFSSCHKWLFGPRGTGMCWFSPEVAQSFTPTIPCYDGIYFERWRTRQGPEQTKMGRLMSPGGFWDFEHRWALPDACKLQQEWGRENIQNYSYNLATLLKKELSAIPKIKLITPLSQSLSSALVCFDIKGMNPDDFINRLAAEGVVATTTPYYKSFARFSTGISNDETEIRTAIEKVKKVIS